MIEFLNYIIGHYPWLCILVFAIFWIMGFLYMSYAYDHAGESEDKDDGA